MKEIVYNEASVMRGKYPEIKKLGICSPWGEATPVVWNGRLMRLELCDPYKGTQVTEEVHSLIRDAESGEIISRVAYGCYFQSGYLEGDTFYVLGVDSQQRDTIRIFESKDLIHWTGRQLLRNPGWVYYNTGLTKGLDGYVLLMESSEPRERIGEPFTHVFATSPDLIHWTFLDPEIYSLTRARYQGGPWLKYVDGWYYAIAVEHLPCNIYTNYLFRSQDLKNWYVGKYNPLLMASNEDKKASPYMWDISQEEYDRIQTAYNINNSDIDMCDWNGKTYIMYLCGNQLGNYWAADAVYDGTVKEFLEGFFI